MGRGWAQLPITIHYAPWILCFGSEGSEPVKKPNDNLLMLKTI